MPLELIAEREDRLLQELKNLTTGLGNIGVGKELSQGFEKVTGELKNIAAAVNDVAKNVGQPPGGGHGDDYFKKLLHDILHGSGLLNTLFEKSNLKSESAIAGQRGTPIEEHAKHLNDVLSTTNSGPIPISFEVLVGLIKFVQNKKYQKKSD